MDCKYCDMGIYLLSDNLPTRMLTDSCVEVNCFHVADLQTGLIMNDDGSIGLYTRLVGRDNMFDLAYNEASISFCPICGRKLGKEE